MIIYAVIDTNVLVSALLTKDDNSPTKRILQSILDGTITPLYHQEILKEYYEVLKRPKFQFQEDSIITLIQSIQQIGLNVIRENCNETLIDPDDLIFYEVALGKRDENSYLITGNLKHFPLKDFIVSPKEMIEIIENYNRHAFNLIQETIA